MEMQIDEAQDGSVIVQMPEGEDNPQDNVEKLAEGGGVEDLNDDDGLDNDPDREQIRAARREERRLKKEIHRSKAKESNHLITALKKQNQALAERLANLETRTSGAEMARVDKVIDDTSVQIEYAKMKMKEAVSNQDGDALVRAQELMYESQRKLESLRSMKDNATKQMSQPKQNINVPDPMVQRLAADWMSQNSWYDPQGQDLDSEFAQRIDKRLTEEGFDPSTPDYWEELSDRVSKYLPHKTQAAPRARPRSAVTSSGRDSVSTPKGNSFTLSPDRVAAIKEAGFWENPEMKMKMIRNFQNWDRQNKARG